MILSFAEAAQRAGVSRDTINRHAKEGKFSVTKRGNGYNGIELGEFERVYGVGSVAAKPAEVDKAQYDNELTDLRQKVSEQKGMINALERQIEQMQRQIDKYIELTAAPKTSFLAGLLTWNKKTVK